MKELTAEKVMEALDVPRIKWSICDEEKDEVIMRLERAGLIEEPRPKYRIIEDGAIVGLANDKQQAFIILGELLKKNKAKHRVEFYHEDSNMYYSLANIDEVEK